MGANSGERWSEMDILGRANEIASGRTAVETARLLYRDEHEIRGQARPAWIGRASFVKPTHTMERSTSWRQTSRSGTTPARVP
jgi:hypothetical protein